MKIYENESLVFTELWCLGIRPTRSDHDVRHFGPRLQEVSPLGGRKTHNYVNDERRILSRNVAKVGLSR